MEEEEWWCLPEHIITNTFQRISTTTEWKKFSHLPNSLYTRWDRCNENYDNENLHVPPIKAEIHNFLPQVFFSSTFIPLGRRKIGSSHWEDIERRVFMQDSISTRFSSFSQFFRKHLHTLLHSPHSLESNAIREFPAQNSSKTKN